MSRKRTKKKFEYSKLVVAIVFVLCVVQVVFANVVMLVIGDISGLAYTVPSSMALLTAVVLGYLSKARTENRIKLMSKHKLSVDEIGVIDNEIKGGL